MSINPNPQIENLRVLWKQFDDYFRHKEILSHTIILVEITIFGSLTVAPLPNWYTAWVAQWPLWWDRFLFYLVPLATMVVLFLGLAHSLLVMQLHMRKVADAWGDGIRLALTKWTVVPPKEADLKPLMPQELEKIFGVGAPSSKKFMNEYVFPQWPNFPGSNADSLWTFVPSAVAQEVCGLLQRSYAKRFERIVASVSLSLLCFGLVVSFLRAMVYAGKGGLLAAFLT